MEEIKLLNQEESKQIFKLPNSWMEKGLKKGLQEGLQKGKLEGRQEGRQEGRLEEKRKIALEMLKEGLSTQLIARITKLNNEEIETLRNNL